MEQGGPHCVSQSAEVAVEASTGPCRWMSWEDGELSLGDLGKEALWRECVAVMGTQPTVSPLFSRHCRGRRCFSTCPPRKLF